MINFNRYLLIVGRFLIAKTRYMAKTHVLLMVAIVTVIFAHYSWFSNVSIISSGDWNFQNIITMKDWFSWPYAWDTQINLGNYNSLQSFYGYRLIFGILSNFNIPFNISERILFLWPSVLIATLGMYFLAKKKLKSPIAGLFSSLIYSLNTYILLVYMSHLNIAMAYALLPLIFIFYDMGIENRSLRHFIISGLLLSISWIYDARIGYIIVMIMIFYLFFSIKRDDIIKRSVVILIPFILTILLHNYWIVPSYTIKYFDVQTMFAEGPWISWMNMSHSTFFYHPFWTEGKPTYFIINQPKLYMLFLPLLAFISIFLTRKENKKFVMFLYIIALTGIFLVKQETDPFGSIYTWLFDNFPGFNMFREASKFYILIAFSYSLMLGFSIKEIGDRLKYRQKQKIVRNIFLISTFLLIIYMAKPAFTKEIGGTYITADIPEEYVQLNNFIENNRSGFFRTYWYPTYQYFGYRSYDHPAISHIDLFLEGKLKNVFYLRNFVELPDLLNNFIDATSVRYIIVPHDSENEIYKYYGRKNNFIQNLGTYQLQRINLTDNITVFENKKYQNHFYVINSFYDKIKNVSYNILEPLIDMTFENGEDNFNGESDFLKIDNYSIIKKDFTIYTKVIPRYMNYSGDIIALRDSHNVQYGIIYIADNKGIRFGAAIYNSTNIYFFEKDPRPFDREYSVGITYDGNFLRLSVDGNKIRQVPVTGDIVPLKGDLLIAKTASRNTFFRGKIKKITMFDKTLSSFNMKYLQNPDIIFDKTVLDNFDKIEKLDTDYVRINPTLYKIKANISEPSMLVFSDAYDPYWGAKIDRINGEYVISDIIRSTELYSMINGFWINRTGKLDITVEYEPQKWFYMGIIISIFTIIISIIYLIYDWNKNRY